MKFFKHFKLVLTLTLALGLLAQQVPPVKPEERKEQIPYGAPVSTKGKVYKVLGRKSYVVGVDVVAKLPAWASYRIRPQDALGCVKRSNSFAPDQSFDKGERAEMADYAKSGYDIGHMVPCADQSFDEQSEKESFLLTNMAPQKPNLNRGLWKKLETYVRYMAWKTNHTLIVYVGPIYSRSNVTIGPNEVVVPTGFYKIITDMETKKTWAFIFPHTDGLKYLDKQQTFVKDIEVMTGLDFKIANPKLESEMLPLIDFKKDTEETDVEIKEFTEAKRKNCKDWKPEEEDD